CANAIYPGYVFKQKPVSLDDQSVLLPGPERIRASKFLENPHELCSSIPASPNIKSVFEVLHHGLEISGEQKQYCCLQHGHCCGGKETDGKYKWLSFSEVISRAQDAGSGLIELGIKPRSEECVGIFGVNREEFLIILHGCAAYSMIMVPFYKTIVLDSIQFIANQANLSLIIVNTVENALSILMKIREIPSLRILVMMDPPTPELYDAAKKEDIKLLTFQELEALGKANRKELMLPKPDDVLCIPYTSGTTGTPKGVMVTHGSLVSYVGAAMLSYGEATHYGGTIVSYLPPSHIYEIVNNVTTSYFGRRIAFYTGDVKLLMEEVKIIQPTVLPLVPRLMNVIYAKVMENIKGNVVKSTLLKIALWRKEKLLEKGKVLHRSFWDKVVFKEFQKALGGNVRVITTSSAPVPTEVMNFFRRASGAYIFEGFGQTEVLAATKTLRLERYGGHVGPPIPNNHVKVVDVPEMNYYAKDDIGEVCVKGPAVFKGYFKNEKATKESLKDGWQYTGDIGKWLPNGTLQIVDRKKHIFKLSQGEYIAPEKVENAYLRLPLVLQIFVDGMSDQDYIVALVVPEMSGLKRWLEGKGHKIENEDITKLLEQKEIRTQFLQDLREAGAKENLNSLEQARNVHFILEPFSMENDLLTPTLKVKRNLARKRYESLILDLYKEGPLL
ncbi:hypothetical protein JTE90_007673, partial [Oedothorax gibbosus]